MKFTCKQRGCPRTPKVRGLCKRHYDAFRKSSKWARTTKRRIEAEMRCEPCGKTYTSGAYNAHLKSLGHKKIERFKKLLAQNCIPLLKIGERLGFSREYARQLAARFEITGNQRSKTCTATRHEIERRKRIAASPFIQKATQKAQERGWNIEPVSPRMAIINQQLVKFAVLGHHSRGYLTITGCRDKSPDIVVYCNNGTWLVLPIRHCPQRSTTFSETEPIDDRGVATSKRHDWRQFINAFELLES